MGGTLRKYTVRTSHGVETVMKLNDADAARLGGVPLDGTAPAPADDERAPEPDPPAPAGPQTKARRGVTNKARTAAPNKGGDGGGD